MLYDLALNIYSAIVALVGLFNPKAKKWSQGRVGLLDNIKAQIGKDERIIWFHCASLGEFEQGRPLIEHYKQEDKDAKILVTFFSPSGYELRKNYEGADYIFYLPIDTKANARKFVKIVKPVAAFFVKYEFWKNFLLELRRNGSKVYIVSAIFRPTQLFFKPYGISYRKQLKCFDHLFVQNKESKDLLKGIGIKNVTVSGDTRFDRVYEITQNIKPIELIENFVAGKNTLVAGSTWEKDDEVILAIANNNTDIKIIIAPHEIGDSKVRKLIEDFTQSGHKVARYTTISDKDDISSFNILIIDTIGILSKVYQYGRWAYIGGGFGVGIHNILEAATFGLPTMFGPNYGKFNEALELVAQGGAISIATDKEALDAFDRMKADSYRQKMSQVCSEYVKQNRGACQRISSAVDF